MITWKTELFKADAEKVYEELQSIGETYSPEQIVEFARNRDTELHKCFQWDDSIAAENWRKQQARMIVCSLTVTVETKTHGSQTYRLIEHDNCTAKYKPVTLTVRNQEQYAALLEQAKRDLRAITARYKHLNELSDVIEEIEKVLAE